MRSRLSLFSFFSLLVLALFITSCQKDDDIAIDNSQTLSYRDAQSFTYSLDSAAVGDSVLITFDAGNGADCGHVQIQVGLDGEWVGGSPVTPDSGLADMLFIPEVPGTYAVRAKYTRTGNPAT